VSLDDEFGPVLDAARAGADWAWARLYEDLAPVLLGYLRVHGAPEPEDLLGETFLQVVRDLERFDGDEAAWRSWVFTIAHRRLVDDRRRRGRRPVAPADDAVLDDALPPVRGGEPDALERLGTEQVLRLLDGLTEDQRDALALRFVAGLSLPEVAEAMGRSANATKALQRRGLRTLRRHLEVADP
jgi:RNA polymerase sigma factor (sigma-70 family)